MRVIESEGNINKHPFDMPVCVSIIASSITSDHCLQPSIYRISSAGRKDCHPAPWIWKEMNLRCVFFFHLFCHQHSCILYYAKLFI